MGSLTPVSRYTSRNSKKRVFPGESSSLGFKDIEFLEVSPPINGTSKSKSSKQKEVICHEVIDVDMEEDDGDVIMLTDGEVDRSGKGKEALSNFAAGHLDIENDGSGSDVQLSNNGTVDDLESNLFYGEDEWIDTYYDDIVYDDDADMYSQFDHMDVPPGVEVPFPWLPSSGTDLSPDLSSSQSSMLLKPIQINDLTTSMSSKKGTQAASQHLKGKLPSMETGLSTLNEQNRRTTRVEQINLDETMQKFDLFKKFDTVEDYSDHHYCKHGSSAKKAPKSWAKRIQEEWKILEKDLPDKIFVRVYESRMDLLRAVIVGAEGTPYHDGLFFFDVFFPSTYPNVPPHVHYHSGGLRINPNLYNKGKVCLSLLNTWNGSTEEKWLPGVSTMLQVLVSIQGLILNAKPYFNEPGYARTSGTKAGEEKSLQYNETTFIYSLRTMVYSMRKPPKGFEPFVVGHFCKHARDILVSCKAYLDGAQVGCLVKGGVQDVYEGDKSCSQYFKTQLAAFIPILVNAFSEIGAKDCEEFLSLAQRKFGPATAAPRAIGVYN